MVMGVGWRGQCALIKLTGNSISLPNLTIALTMTLLLSRVAFRFSSSIYDRLPSH